MTIFRREYKNYDEYLKHQSSKIDILLKKGKSVTNRCVRLDNRNKRARKFQKVFKKYAPYMIDGKVLCLGARNGAEVRAFRNMGFENSIGIDLNPGKNNKYVVKGDFHNMEFDDSSFYNVFINSVDHIFDIRKLSKEISRVMIPFGILVLEISHFVDDKNEKMRLTVEDKELYESFCCDDFEDIKEGFKEFEVVKKFKVDKRLIVIFKNEKSV